MIHCHTNSQDHIEVDELIKHMVHMVKKGLRKYGLHKGHTQDWDLQLPWLAMGYRFNRQAFFFFFGHIFYCFVINLSY